MKAVIVLAGLLAVAGCQTKPIEAMDYAELQTLGKQIGIKCAKQGLKPNTPAFRQCVSIEANAEQYRRGSNARASEQFKQYLMTRAAAGPQTCVSTGGYGTVTTNCY
ncbi:hypothetical protein ACLBWS_05695 [Brucellaceae bacterium D45D]